MHWSLHRCLRERSEQTLKAMSLFFSFFNPHRRGNVLVQRVKKTLNTSSVELIFLGHSLLSTLAWAEASLQFQWWHTGEGIKYKETKSKNYSWMPALNDYRDELLFRGLILLIISCYLQRSVVMQDFLLTRFELVKEHGLFTSFVKKNFTVNQNNHCQNPIGCHQIPKRKWL